MEAMDDVSSVAGRGGFRGCGPGFGDGQDSSFGAVLAKSHQRLSIPHPYKAPEGSQYFAAASGALLMAWPSRSSSSTAPRGLRSGWRWRPVPHSSLAMTVRQIWRLGRRL